MAYKKLFKKISVLNNKCMSVKEQYLNKKAEEFKEYYLITFNREPKEIEIKKFRKEVVLKIALLLYIPFIIISIIIWQSLEGGIFG